MPGHRRSARASATATRPSSSRSAPCKEKHLTKPELGHLKKADAPPLRHLVEFRDEAGELTVGETVTVEAFEAGQTVKISGISKGKGFQGTIKRHNFSRGPRRHGSHNVRAPGSIGASATPVARVQGHPRPRPDGQQARHPEAASRSSRSIAERQPAARPRRGPRAREAASWRCAADG